MERCGSDDGKEDAARSECERSCVDVCWCFHHVKQINAFLFVWGFFWSNFEIVSFLFFFLLYKYDQFYVVTL